MTIDRSVYLAHKDDVRAAVLAAAAVIPPEGTDPDSLHRWSEELARAAGAITAAVEQGASVLREITLTGTVATVVNPARRGDGSPLRLAQVTIRSDIGDPNKPDRPWIDLSDEAGRLLATRAEGMTGCEVRYTIRQVVELAGGKPVADGEGFSTRTRLAAIEAQGPLAPRNPAPLRGDRGRRAGRAVGVKGG